MTTPAREWDAASYDRLADPQTRWGADVLARLDLAGDETVLDAGCGTGRVTEQLQRRLPRGHVVALDASAAMLQTARARLGGTGRVSFVHADLLALTPDLLAGHAPVDAVFSTATFHWVTDHDALFRRLAAVVRPGGRLVAQCGGRGNIDNLVAAVASLGVARAGHWCYAGVEETQARLAAAGFEVDRVWLTPEPTTFEPGEPFEDYLATVCLRAHLATLPEPERRPFVSAVARAMGEPRLDYVRLNIDATRR